MVSSFELSAASISASEDSSTHLEQVGATEAPSEPGPEVVRKLIDEVFSVAGPLCAVLLLFDDPAADGPVVAVMTALTDRAAA